MSYTHHGVGVFDELVFRYIVYFLRLFEQIPQEVLLMNKISILLILLLSDPIYYPVFQPWEVKLHLHNLM